MIEPRWYAPNADNDPAANEPIDRYDSQPSDANFEAAVARPLTGGGVVVDGAVIGGATVAGVVVVAGAVVVGAAEVVVAGRVVVGRVVARVVVEGTMVVVVGTMVVVDAVLPVSVVGAAEPLPELAQPLATPSASNPTTSVLTLL